MTLVRFEPLDTLFFRDGRPYNQGELSQTGVTSIFPPAPQTLVGAVRAACARALSWRGGPWDERVRARLGDGDDLGPLRFRGPILVRETNQGSESLFPVPAHLLGKTIEDWKADQKLSIIEPESLHLLSPNGGSDAICDLGPDASLPVAKGVTQGAKRLLKKGWWINGPGLENLLQGKTPQANHLVHRDTLWNYESRVGIARSQDTHTTEEGALYSSSHVRLAGGVSLVMEAYGLPKACLGALRSGLHPVGGESRACWLHLEESPLHLPKVPDLNPLGETLRYMAVVITPADTKTPPHPGEEGYAGLPGRVVSACLPRPALIGGWDSVARRPLPLRPHLAPGSVLFLEADVQDIDKIKQIHGEAIGKRTAWGFGLVAVGSWPRQLNNRMETSL